MNINMNGSSVQEENSEDLDPWLGNDWRRTKKCVISEIEIYIIRLQILMFFKGNPSKQWKRSKSSKIMEIIKLYVLDFNILNSTGCMEVLWKKKNKKIPSVGMAWWRMKEMGISRYRKTHTIKLQFLVSREILQSNGNLVNLPNYGNHHTYFLDFNLSNSAYKFCPKRKLRRFESGIEWPSEEWRKR